MVAIEEVVRIANYCIWGFYFIAFIVITIVQSKRFWKTITKPYIDWVLASWCLLLGIHWLLLLVFFSISCVQTKFSNEVILTLSSLHSVMFILYFWVWLLTTSYPWLLSIYITKLSLLQQGYRFDQVKKLISSREKCLIAFLFTISAIYTVSYTIISLSVYLGGCSKEVYTQGYDKSISAKCSILFWINYSKDCIDFFIALTLFILQIFTYLRLKNLMQSRLFSYYQDYKKRFRILYAWSFVSFFCRIFYTGLYVVLRVDRLEAYIHSSTLSIEIDILRKLLLLVNTITLVFYVYFSTKYIHFALFIGTWMGGHRVAHKFLEMSRLITKSCYFKNYEGNLDETISDEFLKISNSLGLTFLDSENSTQGSSFTTNPDQNHNVNSIESE